MVLFLITNQMNESLHALSYDIVIILIMAIYLKPVL